MSSNDVVNATGTDRGEMISFALTEEQELARETARKFAAEELRPRLRELEKHGLPDALRRRFDGLGVSLVDVPHEAGGLGLGAVTACLIHEELAFGDPGAAVALWGPHLAAAALVELATPEQAQRLLAPFSAPGGGVLRGAVAWTETGGGPVEGFATRARRDPAPGGGWVLDGEKRFVINAAEAELTIVFAQVEDDRGWDGAGAFAVVGRAGLHAGPRAAWLGLETVSAGALVLAGCAVPEENQLSADPARVGRFFARAALATAARQVGLARASYEAALAYTQDRHAFGKPVAHFQAVSFNLAEMAMDVDAARWMVWRAAAELDAGAPTAQASVAKAAVQANEAAWRVADDGVQLLGGAGFIQDFPLEKWLRDTKALAMIGGTDELSRLTLAGLGVGLPEHGIQPVIT
jgi:alkylation response protein AidB-like acyl-CoA dehydrogenase